MPHEVKQYCPAPSSTQQFLAVGDRVAVFVKARCSLAAPSAAASNSHVPSQASLTTQPLLSASDLPLFYDALRETNTNPLASLLVSSESTSTASSKGIKGEMGEGDGVDKEGKEGKRDFSFQSTAPLSASAAILAAIKKVSSEQIDRHQHALQQYQSLLPKDGSDRPRPPALPATLTSTLLNQASSQPASSSFLPLVASSAMGGPVARGFGFGGEAARSQSNNSTATAVRGVWVAGTIEGFVRDASVVPISGREGSCATTMHVSSLVSSPAARKAEEAIQNSLSDLAANTNNGHRGEGGLTTNNLLSFPKNAKLRVSSVAPLIVVQPTAGKGQGQAQGGSSSSTYAAAPPLLTHVSEGDVSSALFKASADVLSTAAARLTELDSKVRTSAVLSQGHGMMQVGRRVEVSQPLEDSNDAISLTLLVAERDALKSVTLGEAIAGRISFALVRLDEDSSSSSSSSLCVEAGLCGGGGGGSFPIASGLVNNGNNGLFIAPMIKGGFIVKLPAAMGCEEETQLQLLNGPAAPRALALSHAHERRLPRDTSDSMANTSTDHLLHDLPSSSSSEAAVVLLTLQKRFLEPYTYTFTGRYPVAVSSFFNTAPRKEVLTPLLSNSSRAKKSTSSALPLPPPPTVVTFSVPARPYTNLTDDCLIAINPYQPVPEVSVGNASAIMSTLLNGNHTNISTHLSTMTAKKHLHPLLALSSLSEAAEELLGLPGPRAMARRAMRILLSKGHYPRSSKNGKKLLKYASSSSLLSSSSAASASAGGGGEGLHTRMAPDDNDIDSSSDSEFETGEENNIDKAADVTREEAYDGRSEGKGSRGGGGDRRSADRVAVIVTGCSGSGKTVASNIVLSEVAAIGAMRPPHSSQSAVDDGSVADTDTEKLKKVLHECLPPSLRSSAPSPSSQTNPHTVKRAQPPSPSSSSAAELILQKLVDAAPALESFGNAATRNNPNSSRFVKATSIYIADGLAEGKVIRLPSFSEVSAEGERDHNNNNSTSKNRQESPTARPKEMASAECYFTSVVGAVTKCHLLETARVVSLGTMGGGAEGEGPFHIFSLMFASGGLTHEQRIRFDVWDPTLFTCMARGGGVEVGGSPLSSSSSSPQLPPTPYAFKDVMTSLTSIGFSSSTIDSIFATLAGILHLLNVEFVATDDYSPATVERGSSSYASLTQAAKLLLGDMYASFTSSSATSSPTDAAAAATAGNDARSPNSLLLSGAGNNNDYNKMGGGGGGGLLALPPVEEVLLQSLTSVVIGHGVGPRRLHKAAAYASRDTLAKCTYQGLFDLVLCRLNALCSGGEDSSIGSSSNATSSSGTKGTSPAAAAATSASSPVEPPSSSNASPTSVSSTKDIIAKAMRAMQAGREVGEMPISANDKGTSSSRSQEVTSSGGGGGGAAASTPTAAPAARGGEALRLVGDSAFHPQRFYERAIHEFTSRANDTLRGEGLLLMSGDVHTNNTNNNNTAAKRTVRSSERDGNNNNNKGDYEKGGVSVLIATSLSLAVKELVLLDICGFESYDTGSSSSSTAALQGGGGGKPQPQSSKLRSSSSSTVNDLEQLLINFTNEALQLLYLETMLGAVGDELRAEGIISTSENNASTNTNSIGSKGGEASTIGSSSNSKGGASSSLANLFSVTADDKGIVEAFTRKTRPLGLLKVLADEGLLGQQHGSSASSLSLGGGNSEAAGQAFVSKLALALKDGGGRPSPQQQSSNSTSTNTARTNGIIVPDPLNPSSFFVKHFCGVSRYSANNFATKNRINRDVFDSLFRRVVGANGMSDEEALFLGSGGGDRQQHDDFMPITLASHSSHSFGGAAFGGTQSSPMQSPYSPVNAVGSSSSPSALAGDGGASTEQIIGDIETYERNRVLMKKGRGGATRPPFFVAVARASAAMTGLLTGGTPAQQPQQQGGGGEGVGPLPPPQQSSSKIFASPPSQFVSITTSNSGAIAFAPTATPSSSAALTSAGNAPHSPLALLPTPLSGWVGGRAPRFLWDQQQHSLPGGVTYAIGRRLSSLGGEEEKRERAVDVVQFVVAEVRGGSAIFSSVGTNNHTATAGVGFGGVGNNNNNNVSLQQRQSLKSQVAQYQLDVEGIVDMLRGGGGAIPISTSSSSAALTARGGLGSSSQAASTTTHLLWIRCIKPALAPPGVRNTPYCIDQAYVSAQLRECGVYRSLFTLQNGDVSARVPLRKFCRTIVGPLLLALKGFCFSSFSSANNDKRGTGSSGDKGDQSPQQQQQGRKKSLPLLSPTSAASPPFSSPKYDAFDKIGGGEEERGVQTSINNTLDDGVAVAVIVKQTISEAIHALYECNYSGLCNDILFAPFDGLDSDYGEAKADGNNLGGDNAISSLPSLALLGSSARPPQQLFVDWLFTKGVRLILGALAGCAGGSGGYAADDGSRGQRLPQQSVSSRLLLGTTKLFMSSSTLESVLLPHVARVQRAVGSRISAAMRGFAVRKQLAADYKVHTRDRRIAATLRRFKAEVPIRAMLEQERDELFSMDAADRSLFYKKRMIPSLSRVAKVQMKFKTTIEDIETELERALRELMTMENSRKEKEKQVREALTQEEAAAAARLAEKQKINEAAEKFREKKRLREIREQQAKAAAEEKMPIPPAREREILETIAKNHMKRIQAEKEAVRAFAAQLGQKKRAASAAAVARHVNASVARLNNTAKLQLEQQRQKEVADELLLDYTIAEGYRRMEEARRADFLALNNSAAASNKRRSRSGSRSANTDTNNASAGLHQPYRVSPVYAYNAKRADPPPMRFGPFPSAHTSLDDDSTTTSVNTGEANNGARINVTAAHLQSTHHGLVSTPVASTISMPAHRKSGHATPRMNNKEGLFSAPYDDSDFEHAFAKSRMKARMESQWAREESELFTEGARRRVAMAFAEEEEEGEEGYSNVSLSMSKHQRVNRSTASSSPSIAAAVALVGRNPALAAGQSALPIRSKKKMTDHKVADAYRDALSLSAAARIVVASETSNAWREQQELWALQEESGLT